MESSTDAATGFLPFYYRYVVQCTRLAAAYELRPGYFFLGGDTSFFFSTHYQLRLVCFKN